MTTTTRLQPRSGLRMLATRALTLVATATAACVWLTSTGSALAGEPARARLTSALSGGSGSTATAYFTSTNTATTVLKWPEWYAYGTAAAGTPCSTYNLPEGAETSRVIIATGSYRKCA